MDVPSKTMVLLPYTLRWHMSAIGDQPAMQVDGYLHVTNISSYDVRVKRTELRKPVTVGETIVLDHNSYIDREQSIVPQGMVSDIRFVFFVQPPICAIDKPFKADIVIFDQFDNKHWVNGLEFSYEQN